MKQLVFIGLAMLLYSCNSGETKLQPPTNDTAIPFADSIVPDSTIAALPGSNQVNTGNTNPGEVVAFAKTLIGVPYKYASADPAQGFDCSGFITYVFNHFKIEVPRSSIDFTNTGTAIDRSIAKAGDLILFTGTDTLETQVGHMGIVTENTDSLRFIHSTSGKKYGVTITALNEYYLKRFVKVIRIF